jgi:hypothetical protein
MAVVWTLFPVVWVLALIQPEQLLRNEIMHATSNFLAKVRAPMPGGKGWGVGRLGICKLAADTNLTLLIPSP